jgi:tetratricopeptide (TPR) repeat protein
LPNVQEALDFLKLHPPSLEEVARNYRPLYKFSATNQCLVNLLEAIVQVFQQNGDVKNLFPIVRSFSLAFSNRHMVIGGRRFLVRIAGARTHLSTQIKLLPVATNRALLKMMMLFSTFITTQTLDELFENMRAPGNHYGLAEIRADPRSRFVVRDIAADVTRFLSECAPFDPHQDISKIDMRHDVANGQYKVFLTIADPAAAAVPQEKLMSKAFVLTGAFFLANKDALLKRRFHANPGRGSLQHVVNPLPTTITLLPSLMRAPDNTLYPSLIIAAGVGTYLPPVTDGSCLNTTYYKGIVITFRDVAEWSFIDFVMWLCQVAWVKNRLIQWEPRINAIPDNFAFLSLFEEPQNLEQHLSPFGFSPQDVSLLRDEIETRALFNRKLREQANGISAIVEEATRLSMLGTASMDCGKYSEAAEALRMALELMDANQDEFSHDQVLSVLERLSASELSCNQLQSAYDHLIRTKELLSSNLPDPDEYHHLCICYVHLGTIMSKRDEVHLALDYYQKAMDICTTVTHDELMLSRVCSNIGICYSLLGEDQKAIPQFEKLYEVSKKTGNRRSLAHAACNLAGTYMHLQQFDTAMTWALERLRYVTELNDMAGEADAYFQLGDIYHLKKSPQEAHKCFTKANAVCEKTQNEYLRARGLASMAKVFASTREYAKAKSHYQMQLEILKKLGCHADMITTYGNVALVDFLQKQYADALVSLATCLEWDEKNAPVRRPDDEDICHARNQSRIHLYRLHLTCLHLIGNAAGAILSAERMRLNALVEYDMREMVMPKSASELSEVAKRHACTFVAYALCPDDEDGRVFLQVIRPSEDENTHTAIHFPKKILCTLEEDLQHAVEQDEHPLLEFLYSKLIEPIKSQLPKNPDELVVIVPQGILYRVPFAALRRRDPDTGRQVYLLEEHTICVSPSISRFDIQAQGAQRNQLARLALESSDDSSGKAVPLLEQVQSGPLVHLRGTLEHTKDVATSYLLHRVAIRPGKKAGGQPLSPQDVLRLQDLPRSSAIFLDVVRNTKPFIGSSASRGDSKALATMTPLDDQHSFVRAFLKVGVPCVVSTLWNSKDEASAQLVSREVLASGGAGNRAQLLREVMLRMLSLGWPVATWARFACYGYPR